MQRFHFLSACLFAVIFTAGLGYMGIRLYSEFDEQEGSPFKVLSIQKLAKSAQAFEQKIAEQAARQTDWLKPIAEIRYHALGGTITPKVVAGKSGWFFIGTDRTAPAVIDQLSGRFQLTTRDLKAWRLLYAQQAAWCDQRGIDYLVVIAPNKANLYPEYLPAGITQQAITPLEAVQNDLRAHTQVKLVSIDSALQKQKNHAPEKRLFLRTDTHWSRYGAWVAYGVMMESLATMGYQARPLQEADLSFSRKPISRGDLIRMNLFAGEEADWDYQFQLPEAYRYQQGDSNDTRYPGLSLHLMRQATAPWGKAIFFHDSFGHKLRAYLGAHFQELACYWTYWSACFPVVIEERQPGLVINQITARKLGYARQHNAAPLVNAYWEDHFESLPPADFALFRQAELQGLASYLSEQPIPEDRILIVFLKLQTESADTLRILHEYTSLPQYELEAGNSELYFQVMPDAPLTFKWLGDKDPRILSIECRLY